MDIGALIAKKMLNQANLVYGDVWQDLGFPSLNAMKKQMARGTLRAWRLVKIAKLCNRKEIPVDFDPA